MGRGQAERLMSLLEELLSAHGAGWQDLDAIAVGVGPGNFTGIRIGVSAARGLALALNVPCYGVDGFRQRELAQSDAVLPVITAPRDQFYVRHDGTANLMSRAEAEALGRDRNLALSGSPAPAALAEAVARAALSDWPATPDGPPKPYYIRPPDAAPARDDGPRLLT